MQKVKPMLNHWRKHVEIVLNRRRVRETDEIRLRSRQESMPLLQHGLTEVLALDHGERRVGKVLVQQGLKNDVWV